PILVHQRESDREAYRQKKLRIDKRLQGLGLPAMEYVSLEDLFMRAYAVTLLPSEGAKHMVNSGLLQSASNLGLFINTGRGFLVDEAALVAALHARPDLTAVLDVLEGEGQMDTTPIHTTPIFSVPHEQTLILGHTGSKEVLTRRKMAQVMVKNLLAMIDGQKPSSPKNEVWRSWSARSEMRSDSEALKRESLFALAAHHKAGSLERFISFSPAVGRLLRLAVQSMGDSPLVTRASALYEKILIADQTSIARAVLGSLENDILDLIHELQPEAEKPEPYWKPETTQKKEARAAKTVKEKVVEPAKEIQYAPGLLLEKLSDLTQTEVLRLLDTPTINWDMGKLRDHIKGLYPKASIPYFNKIADVAGGVGGEAGFAISLNIAEAYLTKIIEIYRETRRKPKEAASRLGTNEQSLRRSYTVLQELLHEKKDAELAEEEDAPGNLLVLITQAIKSGALHQIQIEKEPVDGKPHILTFLGGKFAANTVVSEEQVRKAILEWLALADNQNRVWIITTLKDQLALLIKQLEARSYSFARAFWGLGLKAEFEELDRIKDQATGHVLNNTGIAFGWGAKAGASGLRDFRDTLKEIEAKYKGTWTPSAEQLEAGAPVDEVSSTASFDALAALGMAASDFTKILNRADVDWSFKLLFAELDKRFQEDPAKKKIAAHLKSRGFDFVVAQLGIGEAAALKIKERLGYYNGILKLTAQSFGITDSALRNLSASLGIDLDLYVPPRGNLIVTLGVTRDDVLRRLRAENWSNFSSLKAALVDALKKRTAKDKPVIENHALSYVDFIKGFGIETEFLGFVDARRGRRKYDLFSIGEELGFRNNQLRNMEKILQSVTSVQHWTDAAATEPLKAPQQLPFANASKLISDWTHYRAMNNLSAKRPAPVLIHRAWYYDWANERRQRKAFSPALQRFGQKLESSI
ncbi:MAG: hypothetical protein KBC91_08375, partial [Candidatus Omnitrophica bacterium]|nr:hypothetical protein [Candidatus Omnitrophota bacterium]